MNRNMKVLMSLLIVVLVSPYGSTLHAGKLLDRTQALEADFEYFFMEGGVKDSNDAFGRLDAAHKTLSSTTEDTLAFYDAKVDSIFKIMDPLHKRLMNLPDSVDHTGLMLEFTAVQINFFEARASAARYKLSRLERVWNSRQNLELNYGKINQALAEHEHWLTNDGPLTFRDDLVNLLVGVRLSQSPTAKSECLSRIRTLRRGLVEYYSDSAKRSGTESVVVEVMVGDEPCFLLVDTGSELVTLPSSIILALGWDNLPTTDQVFSVAGGEKVHGKHVIIPNVSYNGFLVQDVEAGILPSGNLGFDGLLGMSYLGRFTVELDLMSETPLKLKNQ